MGGREELPSLSRRTDIAQQAPGSAANGATAPSPKESHSLPRARPGSQNLRQRHYRDQGCEHEPLFTPSAGFEFGIEPEVELHL